MTRTNGFRTSGVVAYGWMVMQYVSSAYGQSGAAAGGSGAADPVRAG